MIVLRINSMNVDKFGHHVHKRLRLDNSLFLPSNALTKSAEGEYNLQLTRLKGVKLPLSPDDAVNKQYIDQINKSIQTNLANIILTQKRNESRINQIEGKLISIKEVQKLIEENLSKSLPKTE